MHLPEIDLNLVTTFKDGGHLSFCERRGGRSIQNCVRSSLATECPQTKHHQTDGAELEAMFGSTHS
jgi:hypothetical protein